VTLERLQSAVAAAKAAGADDVEVSHLGDKAGLTRFANSRFTQAGIVEDRLTRVRVAVDGGRGGAALTSAWDPARLGRAAEQAVEIARHRPRDELFDGFAHPAPVSTGGEEAFVERTAACEPGERADVLARWFARADRDGLRCAGLFATHAREQAVATAAGVALCHRQTLATIDVIALDDQASGFAAQAAADVGAFDDQLIETACDKAVRGRDPVELEPGPMDVVLSPPAVAELLEWMAITSFAGNTVADGTSLLCGNVGKWVCDERITIVDDWHRRGVPPLAAPFDSEGTPRRRVALIERGVAGQPLLDLQGAARLADERGSTGHAPPLGEDLTEGPLPATLVLEPGDRSQGELVAGVERGLLVTRFHYVNGLLDTRRAVMTGMTRDGTFLIEEGKLGRAAVNLRFTESILDALSPGRLRGIGRDLTIRPAHWTTGGVYLVPALHLRGFHFTGKSR
jgi:predicted Zn-dependent protease